MKKYVKKNQGFAMAELLAVCVVVLGLFSIMVSNYLPLLAEYEQRLSYNDVTAEYAAHYIRKIYYEYGKFDSTINSENFWKSAIVENKYIKLYDGTNGDAACSYKTQSLVRNDMSICNQLKDIIKKYGVEEIILTSYNISKLKIDSRLKGDKLYKYIQYLPSFKIQDSRYKTANKELFRLIIKTKDYGYATTALLSENIVNDKCIIAVSDPGKSAFYEGEEYPGVTITGYKWDLSECQQEVLDLQRPYLIKGVKSIVTSVGDDVFKNLSINQFIFNSNIKDGNFTIGKNAFRGTKLYGVVLGNFEDNLIGDSKTPTILPDSTSIIGESAFSDISNLELVSLSSNKLTLRDESFANNNNLKTVFLDSNYLILKTNVFGSSNKLKTVNLNVLNFNIGSNGNGNGLFKNSGSGDEGISVTFGNKTKFISDNMFKSSKIKSIDMKDSKISKIGDSAFDQDGSSNNSFVNDLRFPNSLVSTGKYAFRKMNFTQPIDVDFSNTSLEEIGNSSFEDFKIKKLVLSNNIKQILGSAFKSSNIGADMDGFSLSIPSSVTKIDSSAFHFNFISNLKFNGSDKLTLGASAFNNSYSLSSIDFGSSMIEIGDEAFANAPNLNGVLKIPGTATKIGSDAFMNSQISAVLIGDSSSKGLELVDSSFHECMNLSCVRLGTSIKSVGVNSFMNINNNAKFDVKTDIDINWCGKQSSDGLFRNVLFYTTGGNANKRVNRCSINNNKITVGYIDGQELDVFDYATVYHGTEEVCPSE